MRVKQWNNETVHWQLQIYKTDQTAAVEHFMEFFVTHKLINISEDTQEMSRSTVLLRHQNVRCGTNKDKIRHVWNHRRTNKEELQQRDRIEPVSKKTRGARGPESLYWQVQYLVCVCVYVFFFCFFFCFVFFCFCFFFKHIYFIRPQYFTVNSTCL